MTENPTDPAAAEPAPVEPNRVLIPSALGVLGIELTGELLTRVAIVPRGRERKTFKPLADLKRSERFDLLDEVLGRFSEFLAGARRNLDVAYDLDASGIEGFPRRVLEETAKIPYARTRTYQQLATAAGEPDGYRQVLSALLVNPLPLAIPCHRVVTTKSGVGSYIGGAKKKSWLLQMEKRSAALL